MPQSFELSPFTPNDEPAVELLLDQAFGLSRRTKTSYRLREGNTAVAELFSVMRDAELGIAGVISYWPLKIGDEGFDALLLGPLAVHGQRQSQGIGKFLMEQTLVKAKALGHQLVLLVGDAPYYARVGFTQIPEGQMTLPGPTDPKRFLGLELQAGALAKAHGLVLPAHRWQV